MKPINHSSQAALIEEVSRCRVSLFKLDEQKLLPLSQLQNHRLAEAGRDPWRSSGPNSLLKWGHLKPAVQDYVSRQSPNTSKAGNSTTSLDNLCQCLDILTVIKGFLDVQIGNSFLTALMTTLFICFNIFSWLKHHILFSFLNRRFTDKNISK